MRARPTRRYHLWPHGVRVLDLGDDVHAAAHLRDFAAHDYRLRGVALRDAGSADVVVYYDGQHQSGLTGAQRHLVRAWLRRYAPPAPGPAFAAVVDPSARDRADHAARRAAKERAFWLALALLPAVIALAFVAFGFAPSLPRARAASPVLVSAAGVLALVSAAVTWRCTRA